MRPFFIAMALIAMSMLSSQTLAEDKSPSITCVLAVTTPQGMICVHKDGTVTIPAEAKLDRVSREFWETVAKQLPATRDLFCEWFRDVSVSR